MRFQDRGDNEPQQLPTPELIGPVPFGNSDPSQLSQAERRVVEQWNEFRQDRLLFDDITARLRQSMPRPTVFQRLGEIISPYTTLERYMIDTAAGLSMNDPQTPAAKPFLARLGNPTPEDISFMRDRYTDFTDHVRLRRAFQDAQKMSALKEDGTVRGDDIAYRLQHTMGNYTADTHRYTDLMLRANLLEPVDEYSAESLRRFGRLGDTWRLRPNHRTSQ